MVVEGLSRFYKLLIYKFSLRDLYKMIKTLYNGLQKKSTRQDAKRYI